MNTLSIPHIENFIKNKIIKRESSLFEQDLLQYKEQLYQAIEGKKVLVIGGAGTIGKSFIKAILAFKPNALHVVDTNENGLTELTRELRSTDKQFVPKEYKTYPMSLGSNTFKKLFQHNKGYNIVANFAAHKHVRSEKDPFAIEAMIENNVFMSKNLLDLILEFKSEHFFCVSTDKATNPVNIMGASKKLMENTIMAYRRKLKITTARFANVAFSNGSLLDGYIHRLLNKQPISCPSDVKRYFVSPTESGQICLLACVLGNSGDIFFPKLAQNQMVNFKDITEDFFESMDVKIDYCKTEEEAKQKATYAEKLSAYPVFFFKTDTAGEKLFEEFYTKDDLTDLKKFNSMGIIKNSIQIDNDKLNQIHESLANILSTSNISKREIVLSLKDLIPDFRHIETGKNLDQKM